MNNALLLRTKEQTDIPIEQTKMKAQEKLDFKVKRQMETFFSFIIFFEGGK